MPQQNISEEDSTTQKSYTMIKMDSFQSHKAGSTYSNQLMQYYINNNKKIKTTSIDDEKAFDKTSDLKKQTFTKMGTE